MIGRFYDKFPLHSLSRAESLNAGSSQKIRKHTKNLTDADIENLLLELIKEKIQKKKFQIH